jgi:hypothetical protein
MAWCSGDVPPFWCPPLLTQRRVWCTFGEVGNGRRRYQVTSIRVSRLKVYLSVVGLLSLSLMVACGAKASEAPAPLTVEALKNATYDSEWAAEGVAQLRDGEYRQKYPGAEDAASELVIAFYDDMYAFGDLNSDGVEDAAVVLATSGGGSGTFVTLEAVVNDQGTPRNVASVLLGDRAQVNSVTIESREVNVDVLTHAPDDPMCCPTLKVSQRYVLQGASLVPVVQ